MLNVALHHVSIPTTDLDRSRKFYEEVLELAVIPRPPFATGGVWYGVGPLQIHLTVYASAHFRNGRKVDNDDIHFALTVKDFESAVTHLHSQGYAETLPDNDPMKLILKRTGLAGFPQVFFMDPDRNIIEINSAPFNAV